MEIIKSWVLNENYQALFKVDYNDSGDNSYLNGGILYGVEDESTYPFWQKTYITGINKEPLSDFKTKINSIILGTYNNSNTSAQDNKVVYKASWENQLCNFFTSDNQFRRKYGVLGYFLPYGIPDSIKLSYGYFGIDYKVKTSEYYTILNYIKEAAENFQKECFSEGSYNDESCLYIGHIGGLYEYLNAYANDFSSKVYLLDTKTGSKKCIPILWWCCVSNGLNKLKEVQYDNYALNNSDNLKLFSKGIYYYNKNTGMCIFLYRNTSATLNNLTKFNSCKNFFVKCVELQANVGYIV